MRNVPRSVSETPFSPPALSSRGIISVKISEAALSQFGVLAVTVRAPFLLMCVKRHPFQRRNNSRGKCSASSVIATVPKWVGLPIKPLRGVRQLALSIRRRCCHSCSISPRYFKTNSRFDLFGSLQMLNCGACITGIVALAP